MYRGHPTEVVFKRAITGLTGEELLKLIAYHRTRLSSAETGDSARMHIQIVNDEIERRKKALSKISRVRREAGQSLPSDSQQ